jgi:hypothetical protein
MSEVKFLLTSEPSETSKPRPLYMVFLIKKNVHVEGRRTGNYLSYKQIDWQDEKCTCSYRQYGNEKIWRIVALIAKVRLRDKMMIRAVIGVV